MIRSLAFVFCFLFSLSAHADLARLAAEPGWQRLLYYEKDGAGWKSAVLEADFFLSPDGRESPVAELSALQGELRKGSTGKSADEAAACRFPARARWLAEKSGENFPKVSCPRLEEWTRRLHPHKLALLFASSFVNSPASMFGHTLLRFQQGENPALTDNTLGFGADTSSAGGLAYVYKSVSGGFPGFFSTVPYYLKVQEYSNTENRDFWEYELDFTPGETAYLGQHAWELRGRTFHYYFLSGNCASYLLRFLEVARPGADLAAALPPWAIPSDTVRVLLDGGFVRRKNYRPSRWQQLLWRREALSAAERELAAAWAKGKPVEAVAWNELTEMRRAAILDAAYEFFRYREGAALELGGEAKLREKKLLDERARLRVPLAALPAERALPPEAGHRSSRWGLLGGEAGGRGFGALAYRASLHDLLSDPAGFEANSELVMGEAELRWSDHSFYAQKLDLLRIKSVAPVDPWAWKFAWNFAFGSEATRERECTSWRCFGPYLDAGIGLALTPFAAPENLLYGFWNLRAEAAAAFSDGYRIGGGPWIGFKFRLTPFWRTLWEGRVLDGWAGDKAHTRLWQWQHAWKLGVNQEIRASYARAASRKEIAVGLYFYR